MKKIVFIILGIIGVVAISIAGFIIPENPFEIIPVLTPISFDKPIWVCYMLGGGFLYLLLLGECYCIITSKNEEV